MAVYNEVQVGRYVRFLQKFLGIKGRQPAPLTFSGELAAAWSMFHGAENRYLEGWNRFGFALGQAASAANENGVQLRNPATSNVVAVIEKMTASTTAPTILNYFASIGANVTDLAGGVTSLANSRLDPRGNPTSSLILSTAQTALVADLNSVIWAPVTPNTGGMCDFMFTDNQEITLLPGDSLRIRTGAVNQPSAFGFVWRERALEDSEQK